MVAGILILLSQSVFAQDEICENLKVANVARIDDSAKRIFVESKIEAINTRSKATQVLVRIKSALASCRPGWEGSWAVSFFSNRRLAFYKDEAGLRGDETFRKWEHSYVGEFDERSKKLTLHPLGPHTRSLAVSLP